MASPPELTAMWRACKQTSSHAAAWAFALSMLTWWMEAGRFYYGRSAIERDDGLRGLVNDAVRVLGGWRVARALFCGIQVVARRHGDQQEENWRGLVIAD